MKFATKVLIFLFHASAALANPNIDMEQKLINDQHHSIHYRVSDLPKDLAAALYSASGTTKIANFGERYNTTDMIDSSIPSVQHQFTFYSNQTAAILFKKGGFVPFQMLLVVDRANTEYICSYKIHHRVNMKQAILELLAQQESYPEYIFNSCKPIKIKN